MKLAGVSLTKMTPSRSPGGFALENTYIGMFVCGREPPLIFSPVQPSVQSLASHDGSINRGEERSHRVILWHEEEVDGASQDERYTHPG